MPLEEEKDNSVYIHIPFCHNICSYCDFCKMYYHDEWVNKYLDSLEQEIKRSYQHDHIKTIYIGGGTPSCLNIKQMNKLFEIIKIFKTTNDCEITIECNIEDICKEKLGIFKQNKVNRLSIGVQSFNNKILEFLNRNYSMQEAIDGINLAKEYFDNINIDLIYGINIENIEMLQDDLNNFLKLDIPHISIYGLIKESNTLLDINAYQELDDDSFNDMYQMINKILKDNNYIHYEVSNYARESFYSKHNLIYWNNENYYGFGLGASGYLGNIRYENTRNLNKYLNGDYVLEKQTLSIKNDMENEMILGLRKIEGVSKNKFYQKYHQHIKDVFDTSKLGENSDYYFIKEEDVFIENSILVDFI